MKTSRIFLAILLSGSALFAQLVEKTPTPIAQFREFPHAELRNFSTGSYGFDGAESRYNPHWEASAARFRLTLGGNLNLTGSSELTAAGSNLNGSGNFANGLTFRPNLMANIWYQQFMLQVSYSNEYLDRKTRDQENSTYTFSTTEVTASAQTLLTTRHTLQAALSLQASPDFSLTLGAASSSFRQRWELTPAAGSADIDAADYAAGLFKNLQYLFAANYRFHPEWNSYLVFKTQQSNVILTDDEKRPGLIVSTFPDANASYFGHIGYGVQTALRPQLFLSLEMRHQFLEISDTTAAAVYSGVDEAHLWNNELIAGIKYRPAPALTLGLLYARYLKYDNTLNIRYLDGEINGVPQVAFARLDKPQAIVLSGEYRFSALRFRGSYQLSQIKYGNSGETLLEDRIGLLTVEIGYDFH